MSSVSRSQDDLLFTEVLPQGSVPRKRLRGAGPRLVAKRALRVGVTGGWGSPANGGASSPLLFPWTRPLPCSTRSSSSDLGSQTGGHCKATCVAWNQGPGLCWAPPFMALPFPAWPCSILCAPLCALDALPTSQRGGQRSPCCPGRLTLVQPQVCIQSR